MCKKRNRSHTQTHNTNNTTHDTTRTAPQTTTRRTTPPHFNNDRRWEHVIDNDRRTRRRRNTGAGRHAPQLHELVTVHTDGVNGDPGSRDGTCAWRPSFTRLRFGLYKIILLRQGFCSRMNDPFVALPSTCIAHTVTIILQYLVRHTPSDPPIVRYTPHYSGKGNIL